MSAHLSFPLLGLILIALGWPMAAGRVRPNRWYGLRIPATFADEKVWYGANAVAGRDLMLLGAVILVVALVVPHVAGMSDSTYGAVCTALLVVGSIASTVRAWRLANRMLRERRTAP